MNNWDLAKYLRPTDAALQIQEMRLNIVLILLKYVPVSVVHVSFDKFDEF